MRIDYIDLFYISDEFLQGVEGMSLTVGNRLVRVKGKNPKTNRMKTVWIQVPVSEPAENAPSYFEPGQELLPPYEFTDKAGVIETHQPISEQEDQKLKDTASRINESMSAMPPFSRELSTCTDLIFYALALGIPAPFHLSIAELHGLTEAAVAQGKEPNPYIDRNKWDSVVENYRSVTPKQEEYLEKLHVYCDEPLTVKLAGKIIDKITERDFPCPHCKERIPPNSDTCKYCKNDLDDWVLEVTFGEKGKMSIKPTMDFYPRIIPLIDEYYKKQKKTAQKNSGGCLSIIVFFLAASGVGVGWFLF